ncbi:MAG: inositol monophosphatase family protein [Bacteroidales bacterium]|nr:inositol monophosphatase family protein [Bacteroidales bacterium]
MSQADLIDLCAQICALEKNIGNYILEEQKNIVLSSIEEKGNIDFVTYVDKEVHNRLNSSLQRYLPEASIISEEGGKDNLGKEYYWVIDPVDGTTNFIHNSGPYCISIALFHGQEPILGVVYELTNNELYYAWKDSKAYMNGRPIFCSPNRTISNAVVGFGFSYNQTQMKEFIPFLSKIAPLTTIRNQGSAAAEICYIAKGCYDAYVHNDLHIWDIAAASLILKQAGGNYCNFKSSSNILDCQTFIGFNNRSIQSSILSQSGQHKSTKQEEIKLYS